MRSVPSALLTLMLILPAAGQSLEIGNDVAPGPPDSGVTSPRTTIDLANPANATGTVTTVRYYWSTAGCADALKIKFFRRTGDDFTMTAERGPFDSSTDGTITLSPPVAVVQGDLIGIARLTNCGTPRSSAVASDGFLVFSGDVTGTVTYTGSLGRALSSLALYGTGTATEAVEGVLAVVGSTRGAFGSNFKTTVQLYNPSSAGTREGRIVFRPQADLDGPFPFLPYSLGPGQMKSYEDVMEAMGLTGVGSMDLVVPAGQGAPLVMSRIYNDAGEDGTAGFSQDLIACDVWLKGVARILRRGTTGFLFTPMNPAKTRFNVGVRTLDAATTLEVTLKNDAGATVRTTTKHYPPNWFIQTDAATFVNVLTISGNETIVITVRFGSAIIYGSTNDNITNDPSVQFAFVVFSSS